MNNPSEIHIETNFGVAMYARIINGITMEFVFRHTGQGELEEIVISAFQSYAPVHNFTGHIYMGTFFGVSYYREFFEGESIQFNITRGNQEEIITTRTYLVTPHEAHYIDMNNPSDIHIGTSFNVAMYARIINGITVEYVFRHTTRHGEQLEDRVIDAFQIYAPEHDFTGHVYMGTFFGVSHYREFFEGEHIRYNMVWRNQGETRTTRTYLITPHGTHYIGTNIMDSLNLPLIGLVFAGLVVLFVVRRFFMKLRRSAYNKKSKDAWNRRKAELDASYEKAIEERRAFEKDKVNT